MKLQLIRNATLRIDYGGHCFLIDPYFAEKFSRPSFAGKSMNPTAPLPFIPAEIMKRVEMVIVSHLHSDHFDPAAKAFLPKDTPIICQPDDVPEIRKEGFNTLMPVKEVLIWKGISITRIPGEHGSGEVLEEMGHASGFVFQSEGEPTVYWVGDTILCDKVQQAILTNKPDIVITHSCGAVWGDGVKIVMDDVQTMQVCQLAPESIIVATHMDAVDHATVSRVSLRAYANERNISVNQLLVPEDGDILDFSKPYLHS